MSVLEVKPEFLYPYSREFPFDEVAEKIVKAMEKRNWKVPGITVEFYTCGSGEEKYKSVRQIKGQIKGNDFKLYFSRIQGMLRNNLLNIAALQCIYNQKQSIEVFEDGLPFPIYSLYIGEDWEKDKEEWFTHSCTEQIYNMEKLGSRRKPIYRNECLEINSKQSEQKFKEFTSWLEEFVLEYILSFPEKNVTKKCINKLIPYTGPWTTIFSLCKQGDAKRILKGKENPNELPLKDRHAYFGSGIKLVPSNVPCRNRFPQIARNGFIWCDVNPNITQSSKYDEISQTIACKMGHNSRFDYIIAVRLKYANDVYVADNAKYDEKFSQHECLTYEELDEALDEALAARGATIIPINKYKGNYKDPIVLIDRELDFDEIEWLVNL